LSYFDNSDDPASAGFRRVLVTEGDHPYLSAWWPPGHVLGWEHSFVHEVRDLVTAIGTGTDIRPTFADGLQVQRVLDAVQASSANHSTWQEI
jgi:predicted dehydrogenase